MSTKLSQKAHTDITIKRNNITYRSDTSSRYKTVQLMNVFSRMSMHIIYRQNEMAVIGLFRENEYRYIDRFI